MKKDFITEENVPLIKSSEKVAQAILLTLEDDNDILDCDLDDVLNNAASIVRYVLRTGKRTLIEREQKEQQEKQNEPKPNKESMERKNNLVDTKISRTTLERHIIGCFLFDDRLFPEYCDDLKEEYFITDFGKKAFHAMTIANNNDEPVDLLTVAYHSNDKKFFVTLTEIMASTASSAHIEEYINELIRRNNGRKTKEN